MVGVRSVWLRPGCGTNIDDGQTSQKEPNNSSQEYNGTPTKYRIRCCSLACLAVDSVSIRLQPALPCILMFVLNPGGDGSGKGGGGGAPSQFRQNLQFFGKLGVFFVALRGAFVFFSGREEGRQAALSAN